MAARKHGHPDPTWSNERLKMYILRNEGTRLVTAIVRRNPGIQPSEIPALVVDNDVSPSTISRTITALRLMEMFEIGKDWDGSLALRDPKLYLKDIMLTHSVEA